MTFRWLLKQAVLAIHTEQLAEHGGVSGLRDEGLLESALARPQNLATYGGETDPAALAAAYAWGILRNHPFVDGNKRTAFVCAATFLLLNGTPLDAGEAEVVAVFLQAAAGEIREGQLAEWLRLRAMQRLEKSI
jgi:death-on-curing protein